MKSQKIPAIAGSAFRKNSRRKGAINRGRVAHVQKSAKRRRHWGECPQNPAAQIDGQPHRIFRGYLEISATTGPAFRKNSRREGDIKLRRARNVQKSEETRRGGANGPRIRRPGSTASRIGSAGDLEKSRRSPGPPPRRILGAREKLSGERQKCT